MFENPPMTKINSEAVRLILYEKAMTSTLYTVINRNTKKGS
jgi:hypothetical protein